MILPVLRRTSISLLFFPLKGPKTRWLGSEATYPKMFFVYPDPWQERHQDWEWSYFRDRKEQQKRARKLGAWKEQRESPSALPALSNPASHVTEPWVGPRLWQE